MDRSSDIDLKGTITRLRLSRRILRLISTPALWKRNACVVGGLRKLFGDLAESDGHLFHIDPRDRTVGEYMRRRGVWSPSETRLFNREVRPGMCVVDAGANLGYFTLLFARCVGAAGRVVAFEPEPTNTALLSKNVRLNRYSNVAVVGKALSDKPGELTLFLHSFNYGDHRFSTTEKDRESIRVPVTTLDEYFPPRTRVDFIKMDIQGAEYAALMGARRVIEENPRLMIATEFASVGLKQLGHDPRAFLDELVRLGFEISILETGKRGLIPIRGAQALERLSQREDEVNLFCTRG